MVILSQYQCIRNKVKQIIKNNNNKKKTTHSFGLATMEFVSGIITVYLDMSFFIQESLITNIRLTLVYVC